MFISISWARMIDRLILKKIDLSPGFHHKNPSIYPVRGSTQMIKFIAKVHFSETSKNYESESAQSCFRSFLVLAKEEFFRGTSCAKNGVLQN